MKQTRRTQNVQDEAQTCDTAEAQPPVQPTCALVLQTLAVVSLLTDAVVLSGVRAALTAGHQVAAIRARFAQGGAARQIFLDVAASWEVYKHREAPGAER